MKLPEFLSQEGRGYLHLHGHRIGLDDVVHLFQLIHVDTLRSDVARDPVRTGERNGS